MKKPGIVVLWGVFMVACTSPNHNRPDPSIRDGGSADMRMDTGPGGRTVGSGGQLAASGGTTDAAGGSMGGVLGSGGTAGQGGMTASSGGQTGSGGITACSNGATRSCAIDNLLGNCAAGQETCAAGTWGPCSIAPAAADSCDTAGDDANCNGAANEGCKCMGTGTRLCGSDGLLGNCAKGTEACAKGKWGPCSVSPLAADDCGVKGDDANCNGKPNENCLCVTGDTQPCGPSAVGSCKPGTATCTDGKWGNCIGGVSVAARDCASPNDSDCDGHPDNTIDAVCQCALGAAPRVCGTHPQDGMGQCHAGTQPCVAGPGIATSNWGACTGSVGPGAELCNNDGVDENCDGRVNENPPCACINGRTQSCGNCNGGTQTCANGAWGTCLTQPPAPTTYHRDADGDAYGSPTVTMQTCTGVAPVGYILDGTDCCDSDRLSYPGRKVIYPDGGGICAGVGYSIPNACGSYDWNCDGTAKPMITKTSGTCPSAVTRIGDGWTGSTIPGCGQLGSIAHSAPPCDEAGCDCVVDNQLQCCF